MRWQGQLLIDEYLIPVTVSLKKLDELILGEWGGRGTIDNNSDNHIWLHNNKGKVLDTDIGPVMIKRYRMTPEKLLIHFAGAGAPAGKLAEETRLLRE